MSTPQPTVHGEARTMVVCPGNGTRYLIVTGTDADGNGFVALPDFHAAATMDTEPVEWTYVAAKLGLAETDAKAVLTALQTSPEEMP